MTNRHTLPLWNYLHVPHRVSNDTVSELRIIMGSPPLTHEVLHFSSITSPPEYSMQFTLFYPNTHAVGSPRICRPIPFPCRTHLPSLQPVCADQNHREHHSVAMNDTHNYLSHYCCSSDKSHQCLQTSETTSYPSIQFLSSMILTSGNFILREDYQESFKKGIQWTSCVPGGVSEKWDFKKWVLCWFFQANRSQRVLELHWRPSNQKASNFYELYESEVFYPLQ